MRSLATTIAFSLLALVALCLPRAADAAANEGHAADVPDFAAPGPHKVDVLRAAGCCDSKGNPFDYYLPARAGADAPLPLLAWGNGSWASPDKYDYVLRHIASWGFAVVVSHDNRAADGQSLLDAVEHALVAAGEADSPLAGRIDPARIGVAGHSQGAGGAMNALMAIGGRLRTAIAVNLPSQKLCAPGDCERIPLDMPPGTSVLLLTGSQDGIAPPTQPGPTDPPHQSVRAYYDAVPPDRAKAMGALAGADHNDIQGQPECPWLAFGCERGAAGFVGYLVAWLAWQLQDNADAGPAYFGEGDGRMFRDADWIEVASEIAQ